MRVRSNAECRYQPPDECRHRHSDVGTDRRFVENQYGELSWRGGRDLVGAAMKGKETRFGVPLSSQFASSTTLTSTGGAGSGLYGMLVLAVITDFVAGLMVRRTLEYLRMGIGPREMKLASLYFLTTPAIVLVGTGVSMRRQERPQRGRGPYPVEQHAHRVEPQHLHVGDCR